MSFLWHFYWILAKQQIFWEIQQYSLFSVDGRKAMCTCRWGIFKPCKLAKNIWVLLDGVWRMNTAYWVVSVSFPCQFGLNLFCILSQRRLWEGRACWVDQLHSCIRICIFFVFVFFGICILSQSRRQAEVRGIDCTIVFVFAFVFASVLYLYLYLYLVTE